MGSAIASGTIKNKVFKKNEILIIETNNKRINYLKRIGYVVVRNLSKLSGYKAIILAVKPNEVKGVVENLRKKFHTKIPIVSIAAGIKIKTILSLLSKDQPIVRVMPNTPVQVGKGISVICYKNIDKKQKIIINKIFLSCGELIELDEKYFDAVTAISGSGPAYFCYFIECLFKSAQRLGFSKEIAQRLVLQTALGTILLLNKENLKAEELRKKVTSKKGTTEAALNVLQNKDLEKIIYLSVKAAKNRAKELSGT